MKTREQLHEELLMYGIILQDNEFECDNGYHRIRIIQLEEHIYYDYMYNGKIIECKELI